jgi:hypothetical protein
MAKAKLQEFVLEDGASTNATVVVVDEGIIDAEAGADQKNKNGTTSISNDGDAVGVDDDGDETASSTPPPPQQQPFKQPPHDPTSLATGDDQSSVRSNAKVPIATAAPISDTESSATATSNSQRSNPTGGGGGGGRGRGRRHHHHHRNSNGHNSKGGSKAGGNKKHALASQISDISTSTTGATESQ